MRLIMLGPPGAGKGTQAKVLAGSLEIPHISTGDIFRAAIAGGTPLGLEAKRYMDGGGLVPDDVTVGIVRERLAREDCRKGFLLDGFPRTVPQAERLDEILAAMKVSLDGVLEIQVPAGAVVERLVYRRHCTRCGRIYNLKNNPPRVEGICDEDGEPLAHRQDDTREVIENRITVYEQKTGPLVDYYEKARKLVPIDGNRPIGEVLEDIGRKLEISVVKG